MTTLNIKNEIVKKAIDALQNNDKSFWFSLFSENVDFLDNGELLNFKSFFENVFNTKKKFVSIDESNEDSTEIRGKFYAGEHGTFPVFFKFSFDNNNKINRLEIGQF